MKIAGIVHFFDILDKIISLSRPVHVHNPIEVDP